MPLASYSMLSSEGRAQYVVKSCYITAHSYITFSSRKYFMNLGGWPPNTIRLAPLGSLQCKFVSELSSASWGTMLATSRYSNIKRLLESNGNSNTHRVEWESSRVRNIIIKGLHN